MFTNDMDNTLVRLGSEIMFLNQLIEQMKKEKDEIINNLKTVNDASEAKDKYIKKLELQADRQKEKINGHEQKGNRAFNSKRGDETERISG